MDSQYVFTLADDDAVPQPTVDVTWQERGVGQVRPIPDGTTLRLVEGTTTGSGNWQFQHPSRLTFTARSGRGDFGPDDRFWVHFAVTGGSLAWSGSIQTAIACNARSSHVDWRAGADSDFAWGAPYTGSYVMIGPDADPDGPTLPLKNPGGAAADGESVATAWLDVSTCMDPVVEAGGTTVVGTVFHTSESKYSASGTRPPPTNVDVTVLHRFTVVIEDDDTGGTDRPGGAVSSVIVGLEVEQPEPTSIQEDYRAGANVSALVDVDVPANAPAAELYFSVEPGDLHPAVFAARHGAGGGLQRCRDAALTPRVSVDADLLILDHGWVNGAHPGVDVLVSDGRGAHSGQMVRAGRTGDDAELVTVRHTIAFAVVCDDNLVEVEEQLTLRAWLEPLGSTGRRPPTGEVARDILIIDNDALAPPDNLSLAVSRMSVTASWDAPVQSGSVRPAGYHLEHRRVGVGDGSWNQVVVRGGGNLSAMVAGLVPGAAYRFRVRSFAGSHVSGWSEEETVELPGPDVPGVPSSVGAEMRPGGPAVVWGPPDMGADLVVGYEADHRLVPAGGGPDDPDWRAVPGCLTSDPELRVCVLLDAVDGETYEFRVRAKGRSGRGPWSDAVSVDVPEGRTAVVRVVGAALVPADPSKACREDVFTSRTGSGTVTFGLSRRLDVGIASLALESDPPIVRIDGGLPAIPAGQMVVRADVLVRCESEGRRVLDGYPVNLRAVDVVLHKSDGSVSVEASEEWFAAVVGRPVAALSLAGSLVLAGLLCFLAVRARSRAAAVGPAGPLPGRAADGRIPGLLSVRRAGGAFLLVALACGTSSAQGLTLDVGAVALPGAYRLDQPGSEYGYLEGSVGRRRPSVEVAVAFGRGGGLGVFAGAGGLDRYARVYAAGVSWRPPVGGPVVLEARASLRARHVDDLAWSGAREYDSSGMRTALFAGLGVRSDTGGVFDVFLKLDFEVGGGSMPVAGRRVVEAASGVSFRF